MIFNSYKQHIVFYDTGEAADQAVKELTEQGIAGVLKFDPAKAMDFPMQIHDFNQGKIRALVLPRGLVTGWHTDLLPKRVDVHFTYRPTLDEMKQGKARVKGDLQ